MRIIIAGGGKVGLTLAENLAQDNHDIYLIDTDEAVLKKADDTLDVMCIKGNGASVSVLRSAGVESADIFIAVTNRDELNMLCCLMAKKLGAKYTIARIRDPEYSEESVRIKSELDIDMIINPENTTAMRISRIIRFPEATDIDVFYRGRIELVGFRVEKDDVICGKPLMDVRRKLGSHQVLFCVMERDGVTSIPNGSTVFEAGDIVHVIGDTVNVNAFFRTLGRVEQKAKHVMICGGGRIGIYLARTLESIGADVKVIERDRERCLSLCEILPGALIVNGDGTEQELLVSENISGMDVFVALTGHDEDNLIMSLYAKSAGVPKVISKITRQNYFDIVSGLDIDSVVNPKSITAYSILRKVRAMHNTNGGHMESLFRIANSSAEAMEFLVSGDAKHLGVPIRDLHIKKGILISVIVRQGRFIVPTGDDHIEAGDDIIIIASGAASIFDVNDMYEN